MKLPCPFPFKNNGVVEGGKNDKTIVNTDC